MNAINNTEIAPPTGTSQNEQVNSRSQSHHGRCHPRINGEHLLPKHSQPCKSLHTDINLHPTTQQKNTHTTSFQGPTHDLSRGAQKQSRNNVTSNHRFHDNACHTLRSLGRVSGNDGTAPGRGPTWAVSRTASEKTSHVRSKNNFFWL